MARGKRLRTHYENLGVSETASSAVIRAAYRALSQQWHPDKHPNDRARAERAMKILNRAYQVLSDPESRRQHDEWIQRKRAASIDAGSEDRRKTEDQASQDPHTRTSEGDARKGSAKERGAAAGHSVTEMPSPHPWRRYFARSIDVFFGGLFIGVAIFITLDAMAPEDADAAADALEDSWILGYLVIFLLWLPIEALFLSTLRTTPGKWIFGIYVTKKDGNALKYSEALTRGFLVLLQGSALALPIISLVAHIVAYHRLHRTGTVWWDESVGSLVQHTEWGGGRALGATTSVFALIISGGIIQSMETFPTNRPLGERAEQSLEPISFQNSCDHAVELAIHYHDARGVWRTEGWWYFAPGDTFFLEDHDGTFVKTASNDLYYFARTVEGPRFQTQGKEEFRVDDELLPMKKVEAENDSIFWATDCK